MASAAPQPIIAIEALVKHYGNLPVLRGLTLEIGRGDFVALLGPNGSGKSTLIRLLAGLTRPSAGAIRIGGWRIPEEANAVRAQIGLVSHMSLLYGNLTARENLRFAGQLYNLSGASLDERIDAILAQVGLKRRRDSLVRTFSRGMQQRLSIARALLHDPHVLLLDEPYTGLDQDAAATLDGLLRQAHENGHTILMASHQFAQVTSLATHLAIIYGGVVAHAGLTSGLDALQLADLYTVTTGAVSAR
jgi:heme exporter protein A